jgi:hypothetical protein
MPTLGPARTQSSRWGDRKACTLRAVRVESVLPPMARLVWLAIALWVLLAASLQDAVCSGRFPMTVLKSHPRVVRP